jgi:hypothetical protein
MLLECQIMEYLDINLLATDKKFRVRARVDFLLVNFELFM